MLHAGTYWIGEHVWTGEHVGEHISWNRFVKNKELFRTTRNQ